jgi:hypothetical protein
MRAVMISLVTLAMAVPVGARDKGKRPQLDLRAAPRISFSPAVVLLTAELKGGEDLDEYYCPAVEWDWDDGGKSMHEADCAPFETAQTIERRYTAEHAYPQAGTYNVKVTLMRNNRKIAVATTSINVRAGAGDFSGGGSDTE